MSNWNKTMIDCPYIPTVVPQAMASSIMESGDPIKMMDLPTAWFEDGSDRHRIRVNPISAGLRAIEQGGCDIGRLRAAARDMAKVITHEYIVQLEQLPDDEFELVDFTTPGSDPHVASARLDILRKAAERVGAPLQRVVAEMLGRTLN
ncbi:hypothetical protein [Luteimonas sp. MHLX1A]|uniref:hypothetical protein n=1 Tax=Alterluteimonas muca TaxID=2878684 RepID=UPI001E56C19B|nr:hypothetical protein [Luteimonas sp. MHLX1A]MCD9046913.1 hypothetical protein [Luteimonas sp. MHLX1A]